MSSDKITVKQGKVHVNTVFRFSDGPDAKVYFVDTRAKYPTVESLSTEVLYIGAGKDTLRTEPTDDLTQIEFPVPADGPDFRWTLEAIPARYGMHVFIFKIPTNGSTLVWEDDR